MSCPRLARPSGSNEFAPPAFDFPLLPEGVVEVVTAHVHAHDLLAWSLTCQRFRREQRASRRKLVSGVEGMVTSLKKTKWAVEVMGMVELKDDPRVIMHAAGASGVEVLETVKWLRGGGFQWDMRATYSASAGGHLDALRYMHVEGCPLDEDVCRAAARRGHLDVLRWARGEECPWDEDTFVAAGERGDVTMLQWLLDEGCPWDGEMVERAARNGHLEALQWAWAQQGCPINKVQVCRKTLESGHRHILEWARKTWGFNGRLALDPDLQ
mmetsp:Transcript_33760/g.107230  ORF Transcript_33760/g.107230 Transcript_33760/m.107230 type:complete len:269 (-) Transcript_33760:183-989(-)